MPFLQLYTKGQTVQWNETLLLLVLGLGTFRHWSRRGNKSIWMFWKKHLWINNPVQFAGLGGSSSTSASGVEQPQANSDSWTSPRYLQEERSIKVRRTGDCLTNSLIMNKEWSTWEKHHSYRQNHHFIVHHAITSFVVLEKFKWSSILQN